MRELYEAFQIPAKYAIWFILGFALAYLVPLVAPGLTWANTDSDSSIYLASAKYIIPSHPTGAPLFNVLNAVILRVFPASDMNQQAWMLAMVSAVASSLTAAALFYHTKRVIAPLIFLAANLVVAQSTIIESYPLVTLLMVSMYVWRHNKWVVIGTGIVGIGIHHLIGLALLPILYQKWRNGDLSWAYLWLLISPLSYLYVWLSADCLPNSWLTSCDLKGFVRYFSGQSYLIFGLAIMDDNWHLARDLVVRFFDFNVFLLSGFLAALVPIALRFRNDLLTWLFVLPLIHYFFGLPHVAFVYMLPSFAFGAIMATEWLEGRPQIKWAVVPVACIALLFNFQTYDIGRTLDPNLTATQYYNDVLELPDNSVIWSPQNRGWEMLTGRLVNLDHGKDHIIFTRKWPLPEIRETIWTQYNRGKLYTTYLVDPRTYETRLTRTNPYEVWPEIVTLMYWPDPPPDECMDFGDYIAIRRHCGADSVSSRVGAEYGSFGNNVLAGANP